MSYPGEILLGSADKRHKVTKYIVIAEGDIVDALQAEDIHRYLWRLPKVTWACYTPYDLKDL